MVTSGELRDALTTASRLFKKAGADAMRPLGLHPGQNFLLEALREADGGLTTGELARRLGVESPTVTRMTQRMEEADLVRRSADADDGRRTQVTLTRRGQRVAERLPAVLDDVLSEAVRGLSADERARLHEALLLIARNLGE